MHVFIFSDKNTETMKFPVPSVKMLSLSLLLARCQPTALTLTKASTSP